MTREELFDRYLADTLDEAATAELEKLLTEDPEFAAEFAQDLLSTGQFVEIDNELRRLETSEGSRDREAEKTGRGAAPKLLAGSDVKGELPPSLQRVMRPAAPAPQKAPPAPPLLATPPPPPVEAVAEAVTRAKPPPPQPSLLPPPSPPPAPPPVARQRYVGGPSRGLFGEHHEQPVLKSSSQRSPVVAISIAVLLLAGIGVAIFLGLKPTAPEPGPESVAIAVIDAAEGEVILTRDIGQQEATTGTELMEGDVVNVQNGTARIAFDGERTYLHIRGGSEIRFEEQDAGKKVRLVLGELTVEAVRQPAGKPMVVNTSSASVMMMGTKVTIRALSKETLVEVSEGKVRVERSRDGDRVELSGNAFAVVGEKDQEPLAAWEFVVGVNLNGEGVEIDRKKWLSYSAAQSRGLKVDAIGKAAEGRKSLQQPKGYLSAPGLRSVLMTSVAAPGTKLAIKWPQPAGAYQVFVWMMEDAGNKVRSLRLNLEEKLVAEGLGKDHLLGEWNRYGPYRGVVDDDSLDFLLSADRKLENHDPQLAGFAVYRLAGTGSSEPGPAAPREPAPPEVPGVPPAIQPTIP